MSYTPTQTAAANALAIFKSLPSDFIEYAASPERGACRGFAALHDLCDANMLLPDADNADASDDAWLAHANAVISNLTALIRQSGRIEKGDRVIFKAEWQDAGDSEKTFLAMKAERENDDSIVVECQLGLPINPQQRVKISMLEGR